LPPEAWMNNLSINFDAKTASFGVNIVGARDKVLQNSAQLLDNINNSIVFKNPKITGISLQEQEGEVVSSFNVEVSFEYSLDILESYYKKLK
ncbi:MAG: PilN domain-containing protein, partial [Sulfurihydrogenibium azorense]